MKKFIIFQGLDGAGKSILLLNNHQKGSNSINNMETKKYHIQKGFPKNITLPSGKYLLKYTKHATYEIQNDQYAPKKVQQPIIIDFGQVEFIEIETVNDKLYKFLVRIDFNAELFLCLVILKEDYVVKTAWFNHKKDNHNNLDLTKYNRP